MASKSVTNTDIIKLITSQHDEVKDRLKGVEEQVKYTNGQVRSLQEWRKGVEAVEDYKKTQPSVQVTNVNKEVDWQKLLLAALGIASAALLIVGQVTAK